MPYTIITDAAKGISALIDSDGTRALGPLAYGDGAERYLEAFVGALGVDPATLPDWYIGPRWLDFVAELAEATPDTEGTEADPAIKVPDLAAEFAAEQHDAPGVEATPAADPLPPTNEVAAPAGDPQPTSDAPGALAVEPPADAAPAAAVDPNTAAPGATTACASCAGSGTQPDGNGGAKPCSVCGGDGIVPTTTLTATA